jgi:hypothetical protein
MRKSAVDLATIYPGSRFEQERLELEQMVKVEVTSKDPNFPIQSASASGRGSDWRGAERAKQIIRIIFDKLRSTPPNQTRVFGDGNRANPGIDSSMVGRDRRAI